MSKSKSHKGKQAWQDKIAKSAAAKKMHKKDTCTSLRHYG